MVQTKENETFQKVCQEFNTVVKSKETNLNLQDSGNIYSMSLVDLYLQDVHKRPLLKPQEEKELILSIKRGNKDSLTIFYESNIGLIISRAKRKIGRGVPFIDLIQEGSLGLFQAIEKFDLKKDNRFSTYATWWIDKSIQKCVCEQGRTIRLPNYRYKQISKLQNTVSMLSQKLGKRPNLDEIALAHNISKDRITEIFKIFQKSISLDATISEDDERTMSDVLKDSENELTDHDEVISLQEEIKELLDALDSPRDKKIIELRFGLNSGYQCTLEETAKIVGEVTPEQVWQLETEILGKLKVAAYKMNLESFQKKNFKKDKNVQKNRRKKKFDQENEFQTIKEQLEPLLPLIKENRSRKIIELRYGFQNEREHTLQEVGDIFDGISRERVRQIINKTLNNLGLK